MTRIKIAGKAVFDVKENETFLFTHGKYLYTLSLKAASVLLLELLYCYVVQSFDNEKI